MIFKYSPAPWIGGHFADPSHSCNCASIISENGTFGAIVQIVIDNGLHISEGGNDGPTLEEAIANQNLICASPEMHIAHLENISSLEKAIKILKENGKTSDVVSLLKKCIANGEKTTKDIF